MVVQLAQPRLGHGRKCAMVRNPSIYRATPPQGVFRAEPKEIAREPPREEINRIGFIDAHRPTLNAMGETKVHR